MAACVGVWYQWDFNVGHQFHQQVWPLYVATQPDSPQLFGSPAVTRVMVDSACRDDSSLVGVRHGAWKGINQVSQSASQSVCSWLLLWRGTESMTSIPATYLSVRLLTSPSPHCAF